MENDILKLAHKRFDLANNYWSNFFRETKEILDFVEGEQWDPQLKTNREMMGLPCLTANQLPTYLRQITNESRQNCPSIQVSPNGDSSEETSEILADLIRSIEQKSNASTAYDNASWYAAATGFGAFRIVSDYEDTDTFLQELMIKPVNDPTSVLFDPNHKNLDGSDSEYVFIVTEMSKDEYKRKFGESELAATEFKSFKANKNSGFKWVTKDTVTLAEYYYKDYETKTLYKLAHHSSGITFNSFEKPSKSELDSGQITQLDQRDVQVPTIKWCLINSEEILEETTWPGKEIPVICVKGEEIWIDGDRKLKGAVKDAMDSQRVYNFNYSIMAEAIAMAPKTPWVLTPKQIEGFEHLWRDANNSTLAYLLYNPDQNAGGAPQRQDSEPAIQAAISAMNQASETMKSVFGMFGAMLGDQSSQQESYRTVLARQQQSHTTTYHFYDNLAKSVEQAGHILIAAIPTFYSDERKVQLIKLSGEASSQPINNGEEHRDVTKGSFGVVVDTGPSYSTRRQDSVVHMLAMQAANPNVPLGDIIADESDWPGAKRIAARIRLTLPPNIQQAEQAGEAGNSKQAIQQMTQQISTLSQKIQTDQQTLQQISTQLQAADELVKQQHHEILIAKAESRLKLEQTSRENELKKDQLELSKVEAQMSYQLKLRELDLQEKQMELEKAKIAMSGVKTMVDMNESAHDVTIAHIDRTAPLSGIDKSFSTVSGDDVTNA